MKTLTRIICSTFLLFCVASANAMPIVIDLENCTTDSATLDSITNLPVIVGPNPPNLLSTSYNATSCIGVYDHGNDDAMGLSEPNPNIGQLNDGILNGEGDLLNGLEFIDPSDLQDLDGDGIFTDPGWIHLAHYTPGGITYDTAGPSPLADIVLDIGDLLILSFTCDNSDCTELDWVLETKLDIIDQVQSLLGEATFDHLAFSIKASNGFAVYDFNFVDIFAAEANPLLNFNTPYILSGTLNTGDFMNAQGGFQQISHMNIWARDPSDTTEVPEPSTLGILGLGVLIMAIKRR